MERSDKVVLSVCSSGRHLLLNQNKTHCNGGLDVTQSTLVDNDDFNKAKREFKHPLFQLRALCNSGFFTRYPVNTSENGDFNRGCESVQVECLKPNKEK